MQSEFKSQISQLLLITEFSMKFYRSQEILKFYFIIIQKIASKFIFLACLDLHPVIITGILN